MKKYTIGVAIGNANSPHTKAVMKGIYNAAMGMDVNVIFFLGVHLANYYHNYLKMDEEKRQDYQYNVVYDYALLSDVDALIVSYGSLYVFLEDQVQAHFFERFQDIPYVVLEDYDESKKGSSIISNNRDGMEKIMKHLIEEHGYKKITHLAGPMGNTDADERRETYLECMAKHGLTVEDRMIEEGDFSNSARDAVLKLIENNPDMEAMVVANDVMAETVYQVCQEKGIVVGKDIAVTGYDDWDMAEVMVPPLTTVLQDEMAMGEMAFHKAYDLCRGDEPTEVVVPAELKIRASCGCQGVDSFGVKYPAYSEMNADKEVYYQKVVDATCKKLLLTKVKTSIEDAVKDRIRKIWGTCLELIEEDENVTIKQKEMMSQIHELITGEVGTYISGAAVAETLFAYVLTIIKEQKDVDKVVWLSDVIISIQQYVQSSVIKMTNRRYDAYQESSMFIPLISRDMMASMMDEVKFYKAPMYVVSALNIKRAYLLILDKPVTHRYGDKWKLPKKMYLTSKLENGKIVGYDTEERPVVTKDRGLSNIIGTDDTNYLSVFNLFCGEVQYGILLIDALIDDIPTLHMVSQQISSALHFKSIYSKQWKLQHKLEKLVEEVKEKNKILGFISEYDELTGCLNRRGFMERAMSYIHQHEGERAILILGDLDHLKEINDCFGHVEGDFAIKKAAEILQSALGRGTTIARIGGDEFIAILPYNEDANGKAYVKKISEFSRTLNERLDKDYYIEMSAGSAEFICDPERDLNYIIADSDLMLYEAKRSRRSTIKKHPEMNKTE